ncbi:GHMP family kinase ATP-binding protein [Sphingobium sp. TomTYG75]
MSFVGGGSDLPQFYREYGGAVLSTAIDKYIFVTANRKFDQGVRLAYSVTEEVSHVGELQHALARQAMHYLGVGGGIELTTVADIPSKGTGLGSSSSFAVGLLNVLHGFMDRFATARKLADEACHIEINLLGEPIGKQDQYAAAYGGLKLYEFHPDDTVTVSPIIMARERRNELARRIIMFYTGVTRSASAILADQAKVISSDQDKILNMKRMVELTYVLRDALHQGDLHSFGEILHENWELKKTMARGVSNAGIDAAYELARAAGATGGKILGAGAGGFLIFYAQEDRHEAIAKALAPMRRIDFSFEDAGSQIIFAE